ncbi:MAG: three-Cys-motif partner protein TcmP [Planctomycetota bacterium]
MGEDKLDYVGYWTEIKLQILRDYAKAYVKIMNKQSHINHYAFIDGFAGAGTHVSKATGEEINGSPVIALEVEPAFSHYHFIDLEKKRVERLRQIAETRSDVSVYEGDCNNVLLKEVFPRCKYEDFRRALCLLDPYNLNPNWEVVQTAAEMKSIEIFLNFSIMDINRNILSRKSEDVVT